MVDAIKIEAKPRDQAGKGAARAARRAGMVPAVIYGDKKPPVMINLDLLEINQLLKDPGYSTRMYDVVLDGEANRVVARDVQFEPVMDEVIHMDFLRVGERTTIHVEVPVHFTNEGASPGLKRGGVLNVVRHEVEVVCRADSIPEHLTVDLTGYDVGDSIHISNVTLPAGVRPSITDRDFTIATIAAPSGLKSEAAAEAAV
jgi:large subunit ribosomal protein L25